MSWLSDAGGEFTVTSVESLHETSRFGDPQLHVTDVEVTARNAVGASASFRLPVDEAPRVGAHLTLVVTERENQ